MSEKDLFGKWSQIEPGDELAVMQLIDANVKKPQDFKSCPANFFHVIGDKNKKLKVLDFGCGIGRNLVGMVRYSPAWEIYGYDNTAMLARAEIYLKENLRDKERNQIILFNEWYSGETAAKYDCIFCCLVLQHLPAALLTQRLAEFAELSDWLVVLGRQTLDDLTTPVAKFLEKHFKIVKEEIITWHVPIYDEHRFTLLKVAKEKHV